MKLHNQHTHHQHDVQADHHLLDHFYVVTMISNPIRYQSRYRLYREFEERMEQAGVHLLTVEVSFGERAPKLIHNAHPKRTYVHLVAKDELWLKENALNVGISRLPSTWKYAAWIDADVSFVRPDWAVETVHQLQHYDVVQMFQTAVDLGPTGEAFNTYNGFMWSYLQGLPFPKPHKYYPYWHPGYSYAIRRSAFDALGGLIDYAVLGSGDYHMATCLIGRGEHSISKGLHPNYRRLVMDWQDRANTYINKNVGFVPGTLLHHFHGKKADRRYHDRWKILVDNQFDPLVDLKRDSQMLYQLDCSNKLRDDIRAYMRGRNEDSIDLE